jgi:deazaflavin-dependent oxidoreductase (nitroreductase family)
MTGAPTQLGDLARRLPRITLCLTAAHRAVVVRTRGRVCASWFGAPILILETVGRRSGRRRATPLVYLPHDAGFAVVPANAGAVRPPAWWLNLQVAGEGFVVLGNERYRITPAIAAADERQQLWELLRAVAPIDHYQRRTRRVLPVVILRRAAAGAPLRDRTPARLRPLAA